MFTKNNNSNSSILKDTSSRNFNKNLSVSFRDKNNYKNYSKHLKKISSPSLLTSANFSNELTDINIEYENYISSLKQQLLFIKQENKKKQNEANSIKKRLNILHSQEEENLKQFQKIKDLIKKIKRNKLENEKLNAKKYKYYKNNSCLSQNYSIPYSNCKNLKLSNKSLHKRNLDPFYNKNEKQIIPVEINNIPKTNINNNINILINGERLDNEMEKFKKMLIRQVNDDEIEKKRLQNEITKIELEESKILRNLSNSFNNIEINNNK